MKKITNSFIKNIVRQSLNESYRLLTEDVVRVEPYELTLPEIFAKIPAGTVISGMTITEKPDGGFSVYDLSEAVNILDTETEGNIITKGCALSMGKPTKSSQQYSRDASKVMTQLTDWATDYDTVVAGIQNMGDFPTFCQAFKSKMDTFIKQVNSEDEGNYGTNDDKGDYYSQVFTLFQNSINVTNEYLPEFTKEIKEKYKITTDAAAKKAADDAKKAADDAATTAKIGGAGQTETWLTSHPALGVQRKIKTSIGDGAVYTLNTDDPNINRFSYGIIVRNDNQTIQAIKVLNSDETNAFPIDPATDVNFQYALSKTDTWKYNDVIVSDNFIALTTDPKFENPFVQESYRHKGFRYNLLTEVELKLKDKGEEVGKIQKKLQLPPDRGTPTFGPDTLKAVINHQKTKGLKRTDGFVDDETYTSIMALEDPAFELSAAKKSTGDDVTLIQQKLGADVGLFGPKTETAVKEFQEKYKDQLPDTIKLGVVDQATFDLIKKYKGYNYSGAKTNYGEGDWIYIKARKGGKEGGIFDKQYYKIKSVSDDRQTVVLDLGVGNTALTDAEYKVDHVGGVTAKVLFGRNAEGETKETPIVGGDNETEGGETERGTGKRLPTGSGGGGGGTTTTVDTEAQRKRKLRNQETCNTLRQIKQYLNNTKGLSMTVNCKWNQEIRNQVMMALTGESPVPKEEPVVNTQPVPVTDKLF